MRRSAVLFAMLVAMLWQSVALGRPGSTVNAVVDTTHAALHWQVDAHHHHDDGSYALDDSSESLQHVLCDHVCATAALLVSAANDVPPLGSAAPVGLHQAPVPDPDPEGLLRPPRARS